MASINYAARQISVKIVYYGPGLSGKTTNLQVIHKKTPQEHKSDMVSLATETDRTLFFDFLPLDLGKIKQFDTKFQLYTVPGQVYYNATRKLVLRGVDGVVFVADSGADKIQENLESFQNLEDNLAEYGYQRDSIPIILQYNKRDLPNALPIDELNRHINKYNLPYGEGIAYKGVGVFDTLKQIGKIVIDHLNRKYSRSGGARASAAAAHAAPAYQPPPPAVPAYQPPPSAVPAYQPPPAVPAYQPPPAAPAYQPPPSYAAPAPAYAPPQAQAWEQPAHYAQPAYQPPAQPYSAPQQQYQAPAAQPYAAPQAAVWDHSALPSFEIGAAAAPAAAVTADPFYVAPAQTMQTFEKPTVAQPVVEDPFFVQQAPPAQQPNIANFEFGAAPAPQSAPPASIDYDDIFTVDTARAPAAPAANQGGSGQFPFEFEMPPPPASLGGTQQANAPTGGGVELDFESYSQPAAPPPPAAAVQELSFDYQPFTPPAQPAAQGFGAPVEFAAPAQPAAQDFGAPIEFAAPAQPAAQDFGAPIEFAAPAKPAAQQSFGAPIELTAPAQPPAGFGAPVPSGAGYDPFAQPAAPAQAATPASHGGKSELDLEIEKYQREIEEKQKNMRSGGMPPRHEPQEMQPYPGPSYKANYQPQHQPRAHNAYSDFEAELEGRGAQQGHDHVDLEEYPSDSAMFFTSVDRNTAMLKKSGKPPVNPAKKTAQQQQTKGFMAKLLNKDKQG